MSTKRNVAIIGGGAAGLLCAALSAKNGDCVTLFEKNRTLGKKLAITGKGRCNVTNHCSVSDVIANIPTNPKFLYASVSSFSPNDTMALFESLGTPLKTERGNRVFPVSDRARDIVDSLVRFAKDSGVRILCNEKVEQLFFSDTPSAGKVVTGLRTQNTVYSSEKLVIATGGVSYPLTGSTGDGYRFAAAAGHNIVTPSPSLVPLETLDAWCRAAQGLSLKNCALHLVDRDSGKIIYEDFGEMLFTHFGISGPMVLSASSHIRHMQPGRYQIVLDLKPALDEKMLDARICSDFSAEQNRDFQNSLGALLPGKLIAPIIALSGIDPRKKVHSITKEERKRLVTLLKHLPITVQGFRPISEAIVTSGGVNTREINPKTMQSKLVSGLYFAGEVIDVDAYTGGFNLQIAFSTAHTAALN